MSEHQSIYIMCYVRVLGKLDMKIENVSGSKNEFVKNMLELKNHRGQKRAVGFFWCPERRFGIFSVSITASKSHWSNVSIVHYSNS